MILHNKNLLLFPCILDLLLSWSPFILPDGPESMQNKLVINELVKIHLRIEFHSGCIYWIMNAMVKLANP